MWLKARLGARDRQGEGDGYAFSAGRGCDDRAWIFVVPAEGMGERVQRERRDRVGLLR